MSVPPDNIIPITPQARSDAEKFVEEHNRELLTILFTDLVDSTKLQNDAGNVEAARLTELHRKIVRDELAKYDAREIEWAGDSCLAVFTKPSDAVVFALRIQTAHRLIRETESKLPTVRIGMHIGEVVVKKRRDGGKKTEDLFGLQVSEAARVMSVARGNQVFCTRAVFDNARGALKGRSIEGVGDVIWVNYGAFMLKGSEEPVELCEVGSSDVAVLKAPQPSDKVSPLLPENAMTYHPLVPTDVAHHRSTAMPRPALAVVGAMLAVIAVLAALLWRESEDPRRGVDRESPIRSLAVLPLSYIGQNDERAYLAAGIRDEISLELGKIKAFDKVISRTSVMQYEGTEKTIPDIARELAVDGVVEGTVQWDGDQVRVNVSLFHGASETPIWGEAFNNSLENVFDLQSEIALAIANEVQVAMTQEEAGRIAQVQKVDPEAYRTFQAGIRNLDRFDAEGFTRALANFEEAIRIQPDYAQAYSGMGTVKWHAAVLGIFPITTVFDESEKHFNAALAIDPQLSDAHTGLGYIAMHRDRDWAKAKRLFDEGVALNPNRPDAHRGLSDYYLYVAGDFEKAKAANARAKQLDPERTAILRDEELIYEMAGDYEGAVSILEEHTRRNPDDWFSLSEWGWLLREQGRFEEARAKIDQALELAGENPLMLRYMAELAADTGDIDTAQEIIEKLISIHATNPIEVNHIAIPLARLGRYDDAFAWLTQFAEAPSYDRHWIRSEYFIKLFSHDPRYWEILDFINYPPTPPGHPLYEIEQDWKRREAAEAALAAQPKPVRKFAIQPLETAPLRGTRGREVVISQDGTRIVYAAPDALYTRLLNSTEITMIPNTEGGFNPVLSPDAKHVAFTVSQELKRTPIAGGAAQVLHPGNGIATGITWGDDDWITFSPDFASGLMRVPASGGTAEVITEMTEKGVAHAWPEAMPGGKVILYVRNPGSLEDASIYAVDVEKKTEMMLVENATQPVYSSSGHLLYGRDGSIYAVPFNADALEVLGPPIQVLDNVVMRGGGASDVSISRNGTLIYVPEQSASSRIAWVDHKGIPTVTPLPPRRYLAVSLAPDEERVAVAMLESGGDVWIGDLVRGTLSKLTTHSAFDLAPAWAPEGEEIAFLSLRGGSPGLFIKSTDGTSESRSLTPGRRIAFNSVSWDPHRQSILVSTVTSATGQDVGRVSLTDDTIEPVLEGVFAEAWPTVSPDGNWLAYSSNESGRNEIYVQSYPDLERRWLVSTDGGIEPLWSSDGKELFFRNREAMMSVPIQYEPTFAPGLPELLFENTLAIASGSGMTDYAVSRDGKRFLMVLNAERQGKIMTILNFQEELERFAPQPERANR